MYVMSFPNKPAQKKINKQQKLLNHQNNLIQAVNHKREYSLGQNLGKNGVKIRKQINSDLYLKVRAQKKIKFIINSMIVKLIQVSQQYKFSVEQCLKQAHCIFKQLISQEQINNHNSNKECKFHIESKNNLENSISLSPPKAVDDIGINLSRLKNISQTLYYRAKVLTEQEFSKFCDKIILRNKIVLTKIFQLKQQHNQDFFSKQINQKSVEVNPIGLNIDDKLPMNSSIQNLKFQLSQIKNSYQCNKPCCREINFTQIKNSSKAQLLIKSDTPSIKKKTEIYETSPSKKYFQWYYKDGNFDTKKIYSVSRTKTQQMEEFERQYQKKVQQRYHKIPKL